MISDVPIRTITIIRGDYYTVPITLRDINGTVVDLTDKSVYFVARHSRSDPATYPVIQRTTSGGGINIIDASVGQIEVTFNPVSILGDTSALLPRTNILQYDIYSLNLDGTGTVTHQKGRLVVISDVKFGTTIT